MTLSPKGKLPAIQSVADVLLLPLKKGNFKNGTPSKLVAYLLSGKPILACVEKESDVADIKQMLIADMLVEPESIELLSP